MGDRKNRRILGIPDEFWIGFVIMIGFFLKFVYNARVGYGFSPHEIGEWIEMVNGHPNPGHIGVIQYYFELHKLPAFDPSTVVCYSNPPLFYIASAFYMWIFHGLFRWRVGSCLHLIQCVNIIYIMVGVFSGVRFLGRFGVKGRKIVAAILFVTFFPTFTNLTATLNPDALSFMFIMLTLNGILDFYETRKRRKIISTAVLFGLGMATKYNMIVLLPPIILIFLLMLFYDVRTAKRVIYRYLAIFAGIAGSITLFWPLWNKIRYGMPLFYTEPVYESWELIAENTGLFARIGIPGIRSLLHLHLTKNVALETNIWAQTFKTAVLDENAINTSQVVTYLLTVALLFLTIVICITAHVMLIRAIIGKQLEFEYKLFILVSYASILAAYLLFCFRHPAVSVPNIRHIAVIVFFPLIGMGVVGSEGEYAVRFDRITTRITNWSILIMSALAAFLFGFYAV